MSLDIYYDSAYCKLYERINDGKIIEFLLECEYGVIKSIFLKRQIKTEGFEKYYDICTPYGYGGPIILECNDKDKLLEKYHESMKVYCKENNIVSEFIRFHPIYGNAIYFTEIYDVEFSRKTIGTNLRDYDDPVQCEFSKNMRKEIRKAVRNGVQARVLNPENLDNFKKLYYEAMNRNSAEDFYYFDNEYFDEILMNLNTKIIVIELEVENKVIASELYFTAGDIMHAHLLGSGQELLDYNAGGLLEATAAQWGKEHGYRFIHHGGGRTADETDSLFTYKKKFGKNTQFDFYLGKKIWNPEIYNLLCEKSNIKNTVSFFPAYRNTDTK